MKGPYPAGYGPFRVRAGRRDADLSACVPGGGMRTFVRARRARAARHPGAGRGGLFAGG
ncbi:hypothetical protein GCM10010389_38560 [Streptomyces echinoruber]|uniref:Uncharacterized protein n=1 Tax=Streptomyces echinoruber TaxID=68898 RepID=A0A918VGC6_9ACTN|nr:hypothetical protein GCM10010389_38560 [Streptomyces echinoruber]